MLFAKLNNIVSSDEGLAAGKHVEVDAQLLALSYNIGHFVVR